MLFFGAKTGKTSAYFLRFDKTEEIPFWVRFDYGSHLKAKLFSTSPLACLARYIISSWNSIARILQSSFYKKSKQARVHTFVWLYCDDGCDEGTNLRQRDFAVVPLMPTHVKWSLFVLYI